MGFLIFFIICGCLFGISGFKKSLHDEEKRIHDNSSFPFYLDGSGHYRWKSNNQKIYNVTWDNENHLIITDNNFNNIDWTMKEIKDKLEKTPNLIIQFGNNIHNTEMIPGIRYITKVNNQYRYYVSVRYGMMHYYMDIRTERIVMPIPECLQYEKEAKEAGYEYCTEEQIKQGAEILNAMQPLERRKYIDYHGIPKTRFKYNARKKKGVI